MVKALARAFRWKRMLESGDFAILTRRIANAFDLRSPLFDTPRPRWSRREWESLSRAELMSRLWLCGEGIRLTELLTQADGRPG